MHLKFELATNGRKLTVNLSRLSILSQTIHDRVEGEMEIPHFSSVTSKDSRFQNFGELNSVNGASSSNDPVPVLLSHQNQILKYFRALLSLERPDNGSLHLSRHWCGTGSLSGLELTLSVYEVQVNFLTIINLL